MSFDRMPIGDFAAAVGERSPAPASGAATAVAAALAAALVELTARFSDDDDACGEAECLRARLLELADEDADAYTRYLDAGTDAAKERTIDVPLALAESASRVEELARRLERDGNPRLVGDAAAARLLAEAAVRVAARLVELNLDGREDPRLARARELAG